MHHIKMFTERILLTNPVNRNWHEQFWFDITSDATQSFAHNSIQMATNSNSNSDLFYCPTCNRSFTNKRNLTRHLRTHDGVRPWACQKCGEKDFVRKEHLAQHQRICGKDPKRNSENTEGTSSLSTSYMLYSIDINLYPLYKSNVPRV